MNRQEQIDFIKELSNNIAIEIIRDIELGRVPEDWEGHELRHLLSVKTERANYLYKTIAISRCREIANTIIKNNL